MSHANNACYWEGSTCKWRILTKPTSPKKIDALKPFFSVGRKVKRNAWVWCKRGRLCQSHPTLYTASIHDHQCVIFFQNWMGYFVWRFDAVLSVRKCSRFSLLLIVVLTNGYFGVYTLRFRYREKLNFLLFFFQLSLSIE